MENIFINNNESVQVKSVNASIDSINIVLENASIEDMVTKFSNTTELSIIKDEVVFGIYKNLMFVSATVDASGDITINMHIKTNSELVAQEIEELKKYLIETQEIQDEAILELAEIVSKGE